MREEAGCWSKTPGAMGLALRAGVGDFAVGVFGNATTTSTEGSGTGVLGRSFSANGVGVLGQNDATTGPATGVWGQSAADGGIGVAGYATHAGDANGYSAGVYGQSVTALGRGIWGRATGTGGRGIWGNPPQMEFMVRLVLHHPGSMESRLRGLEFPVTQCRAMA